MGYKLNITGKSDKGLKRKNNEDYFLIDSELGYMIVADGMGGHASGEVASQLATKLCSDQLKRSLQTGHVPVFFHVPPNPNLDPRSLVLGDCVKFSNMGVYEAAHSNIQNKDMGTTLVVALWLDDKLAVAHVGDSRLYTFEDGQLKQRTIDHSFVQDQINRGLLKPEDAEKSDMKNLLLRAIGNQEDVEVDLNEFALKQGAYVLVCSDGLTKMMPDEKIAAVFQEKQEPQDIVDTLIEQALQAGGNDNVTAVVARVDNDPLTWKSLTERVKNMFKPKQA